MRYVMARLANGLEWVGERLDDLADTLGPGTILWRGVSWFSYRVVFHGLEMPIRNRWQVWS